MTRVRFDAGVPNAARIYDYLLGGKDNYAADREAAKEILQSAPEFAANARANRAFLGRAVRYLAGEKRIRQFLEIGTGIPTSGNTHQVAQAVAPECRVVYVDYDQFAPHDRETPTSRAAALMLHPPLPQFDEPPAVPGGSVVGVTGKTPAQRLREAGE